MSDMRLQIQITLLGSALGLFSAAACRPSAAGGISKVLLWYKPFPAANTGEKVEMTRTAASGYSAEVPLPPSGLMYLVEVQDRSGRARNFPNVFGETPYGVFPPFEPQRGE